MTLEDIFYEVEGIRGKRSINGSPEYLVKWKGFSEYECTWEPLSNLAACAKIIARYEKERQEGETSPNGRDRERKKGRNRGETGPAGTDGLAREKPKGGLDEELRVAVQVLKRSVIDDETVFKVKDLATNAEGFLARKELLRLHPVALCLFYEQHIQD
jgi:hypothetical protein